VLVESVVVWLVPLAVPAALDSGAASVGVASVVAVEPVTVWLVPLAAPGSVVVAWGAAEVWAGSLAVVVSVAAGWPLELVVCGVSARAIGAASSKASTAAETAPVPTTIRLLTLRRLPAAPSV
jgi:hypothetical protein